MVRMSGGSAEPFFCDVCNYGFDQEFKLNNHKKGQVHKSREKALLESGNSHGSAPASAFRPSPSPFNAADNFQRDPSKTHFSQNAPSADDGGNDNATTAKSAPPTPEEIEAAISNFKEKYIEVDDPKTGKKKQKLIVPDEWEFCKPCGAHLRTQQVL